MATAPDIDEVLCSTRGKENFQRLVRLLISGGTTLLREIFDQLCPPSSFSTILKNPATETTQSIKAYKATVGLSVPFPRGVRQVSRFGCYFAVKVDKDNMQLHPSCQRLGCPANKYRPQFSCRFGENQIQLPKHTVRSREPKHGYRIRPRVTTRKRVT